MRVQKTNKAFAYGIYSHFTQQYMPYSLRFSDKGGGQSFERLSFPYIALHYCNDADPFSILSLVPCILELKIKNRPASALQIREKWLEMSFFNFNVPGGLHDPPDVCGGLLGVCSGLHSLLDIRLIEDIAISSC